MVNPSDHGLQNIRSGVDSAHRPWWRHPATPALAAAVVLGLMAGGLAVALGGDGEDDSVTAGQASEEATTSPSPSDNTTEATDPSAARENVYVYYVMDDGQSPRLFREEHSVSAGPPAAALAVQELAAFPAQDPDYTSPWPRSTRVTAYNTSGDTATVELTDFVSVSAEAENAAMQQLVYTVTANDPDVREVLLLVDGEAPSGRADWSEPVARAPMVDVQGLIWLLGPTEGETVSSPVAIDGYGTAFEGTISWEVRKDGAKVAEGFTQGGANGEFGEFSDTVDLEPGSYEIRAFEISAEDGSPLHVDTKTFTVG